MNTVEKHQIALANPFFSLEYVNDIDTSLDRHLIGVKNDGHIPSSLIDRLEASGKYLFHTIDHMSAAGRAVDVQLINPVSGRWMSGSSSGTAVNVFLGMNDLGIGTDGGGSVLAPAAALNLYGFISNLICHDHMISFSRTSTDGICFTPSIGFITTERKIIYEAIEDTLGIKPLNLPVRIAVAKEDNTDYPFPTEKIEFPDVYDERRTCISFLKETLENYDLIIEKEGPVDLYGFGDTIFGHFDQCTGEIQREAKKGLIRTANMVNASALSVPSASFACSTVGITKSEPEKIAAMLYLLDKLKVEDDTLIGSYFRNTNTWTRPGFKR